MPFDPDKYLAERQSKQTDTPSTGGGFDPDQYLQSKGVQTLPNKGAIQDGATDAKSFAQARPVLNGIATALFPTYALSGEIGNELATPGSGNAIATHLGQGAAAGFNDEAASALSAAVPSEGTTFNQRYTTDRDAMRANIDATAKSHPALSALSELVGSLPLSLATGGAATESALGRVAASTGLSALYGLGKSSKDSLGQAALDTAKAGAFGLALGVLSNLKGLKSTIADSYDSFFNPETASTEIDKLNPLNVGITAEPRPNGDFDIKFASEGEKLAAALKIGKDQAAAISHPDTQAAITDEVNGIFGTEERPGRIPQLITESKKDLGNIRDPLLKLYGANSSDVEGTLKTAWDKANSFDAGGDDVSQKAIDHFKQLLQQVEGNLRGGSPTSSLDDVPLLKAFTQKQQLSDSIYENNLYSKAPAVRRMAQGLASGLKDATNVADTTGQIKELNDAFHTVYRMSENAINGPSKIEGLVDPNANTARNAYQDFIQPLKDLDPNSRAALLPKLQEYIVTDMPKTLVKAQVKNAVTEGDNLKSSIGYVLNKLYNSRYQAASLIGAAPQSLNNLSSNISVPPSVQSAIPALSRQLSQPQSQGSLRQLK